MRRFFCTVLVAVCALPSCALALPNGAPWGSANPAVEPNCSSCHFDGEAVRESDAISLSGLPEKIEPGSGFVISLTYTDPEMTIAGFLITASGGEFKAGGDFLEPKTEEIRSISPKQIVDGKVSWSMLWKPPDKLSNAVIFHVAVNASNGDASPFGDEIHFRSFVVGAGD